MYYIVVKTQFIGFHRWRDAPEEVKFLRNFHRHVFYVEAKFIADHNDRDLEFFIQQRKISDFVRTQYEGKCFEKSCEMIAEEIVKAYKGCIECCISEDGENGGGFILDNFENNE